MTPALKISEKIKNRLAHSNERCLGKIYGILAENNLVVLGLQVDIDGGYAATLINTFPAEVYLCGIISIGDGTYDDHSIKDSLSEVYVTDNPVFVTYNIETGEISTNFHINGQLVKSTFTIVTEQEILGQFLHIRLVADVPLSFELDENVVKEAFVNLRKTIASGVMTFGFSKTSIYLLGNNNENGVVGVIGNPSIGQLCVEASEPSEGGSRKKKLQSFELDVMEVGMFKRMTKENGFGGGKEHAPLCVLDKRQCKTLNTLVKIDALSMVHRQTSVSDLYEILVESAVRSLRLLEKTLLCRLQQLESKLSYPETFHFYPQDCGHFVTQIYLKGVHEEDMLSDREKLHRELLLKQIRPLFRKANRFTFKKKDVATNPLINPHLGIKPTDNGGTIALVKGKYLYFHYCQNKMDDSGWGCAYRSLQTLASWFKLQGYTDKDVPSFADIQQCLVDIGDKPATFVGSKQWIGSTEVNYVLNTLLGVTSKILYVSSGEEMASKGPELVSHFENHGSPVMIGGGVLAHTILGVDYDSQSGNLKFLILDPHYTGIEDLHTIQSKGWCGWKSVDFWNKTYYNMCLPQVPCEI